MFNMDEFKFKINIIDETKKNLARAKDNFKTFFKNISGSSKTDFGKASKDVEKYYKTLNTESKKFKKGRGVGEGVTHVLESVNREDVALMQAMKEKGKSLKEDLQQRRKEKSGTGFGDESSSDIRGQSRQAKFRTITATELTVSKITGAKIQGGGTGLTAQDKLREEMKDVSGTGKTGGGGGALGKAGIAGAIIMATIGAVYGILSARAEAFRTAGNAQMQGIQQMGFGSTTGPAGFYRGFMRNQKGQDVVDARNAYYGLTGSQQVEMMSSYAKQTGGGRKQTEGIVNQLAQLQNAYGFGPGQLGEWAGNYQRFGQGQNGVSTLMKTMQTAKDVGMGGARSEEFIRDMQEALTQAVMQGSQRSVDDLDKSLGALMKTSDERLKAMGPEILQSAMQTTGQAAMMEGGSKESFVFQAVQRGMQKKGMRAGLSDVQDELNDHLLETQQMTIDAVEQLMGKGTRNAAMMMQRVVPGFEKFTDPRQILKEAENIKTGAPVTGTKGYVGAEISDRLKTQRESMYYTQFQDVRESANTLIDANKLCAAAVNEFRNALENTIKGISDWIGKLTGLSKSMPTTSHKISH